MAALNVSPTQVHQALAANKIYEMLDGKQRKAALQTRAPAEAAVGFRGADGEFPGVRVAELSHDQRELAVRRQGQGGQEARARTQPRSDQQQEEQHALCR